MVSLIYLILLLAIVGFILWLILTYVPMPEPFKTVIVVVIVIVVVLWLLSMLTGGGGGLALPRLR